MKTRTILVAGVMAAVAGATALAHGGATGVIKERMDAMGTMKKAVKSLTTVMRGEASYDAELVKKNAATIKSHAGKALLKLFPEGSHKEPSEAKPEIWSDWERFKAEAQRLETIAAGLEMAADNGLMSDVGHSGDGMGMSEMMGMGDTSGQYMMGSGGMMSTSGIPDQEMLASMPADGVFKMLTDTCSSCHTKFRREDG